MRRTNKLVLVLWLGLKLTNLFIDFVHSFRCYFVVVQQELGNLQSFVSWPVFFFSRGADRVLGNGSIGRFMVANHYLRFLGQVVVSFVILSALVHGIVLRISLF